RVCAALGDAGWTAATVLPATDGLLADADAAGVLSVGVPAIADERTALAATCPPPGDCLETFAAALLLGVATFALVTGCAGSGALATKSVMIGTAALAGVARGFCPPATIGCALA